jgi:hypothetical protein
MATRICCRFCRVEFARIALADGSAAILCLDCQVTHFEHKRDARLRVVVANPTVAKRTGGPKRKRMTAAARRA